MPKTSPSDLVAGNILLSPLGPILEPAGALQRLTHLPNFPRNIASVPKQERLHQLLTVLDLHIPSKEELSLQQTIDLLIRQSLAGRDPMLAPSWSLTSGEDEAEEGPSNGSLIAHAIPARPRSKALASAVSGVAGAGKTEGILSSLSIYPGQVIRHSRFPRLIGSHHQLLWISADVPGSGKAADLAEALMHEFDVVMCHAVQNYQPRFADTLSRHSRNGLKMLSEWQRVASSHFLALLHLDEIQNLFKIATLKKRRTRGTSVAGPQLSIAEDQLLKWILTLINRWGISVLLSGTPDGIGALTKRLATTQRLAVGGFHHILPFPAHDCPAYKQFIDYLARYQWVAAPLRARDLYEPIFRLTAGVRRLIMALWIAAHRIAFLQKEDALLTTHFEVAATTLLAPTQAGVRALLSRSPDKFELFEDLKPGEQFWEAFWSGIGLGKAP